MISPAVVRPATHEDARVLAPIIRYADAVEISASSGSSPLEALLRGIETSEQAMAVVLDGKVAALFGVIPIPPGTPERAAFIGVPWLLGSSRFIKQAGSLRLSRHAKKWVAKFQEKYPALVNMVDCRNTAAIQWLDWLGFQFTAVHPRYGVGRVPFLQFERHQDV